MEEKNKQNLNKIICQKDEVCCGCLDEIPRGSWAYIDDFDNIYCEECLNF